jgi:hypothetical protein
VTLPSTSPSTRWRDFTDIASIARSRRIEGADIQEAVDVVARYRKIEIESLNDLLAGMPELAQRKWEIWRRKQRMEATTPQSFTELLGTCLTFTEPLLSDGVRESTWEPSFGSWVSSTDPGSSTLSQPSTF